MDGPGVRKVPEGSGEQGKMEETGSEIICDAPTTLAVKEQMTMMMKWPVDYVFPTSSTWCWSFQKLNHERIWKNIFECKTGITVKKSFGIYKTALHKHMHSLRSTAFILPDDTDILLLTD